MSINLSKEEFDKIFKLMQESFPESEYRPYEKQLKLLSLDNYKIHTKYDENKNLIAFIALWDFPNFIFIEHLAVSPLCRGKGTGTKVMKEIIKNYKKPIVLEIEPPKNDITIKRCKFYERLGFHICDYEYYQEPLRKGDKELRLNLMSCPYPLNKDNFEYVSRYIRQHVYIGVN